MRNPASPPNLFTYTMSIEIERAQAITWIRIQMAQHGLTLVQLAGRRLLCRAAATTTGGGVLSQHAGAGLGRPRRHAGLAAAGGPRRADGGTFPGARCWSHGACREGAFRFEIDRLVRGAADY